MLRLKFFAVLQVLVALFLIASPAANALTRGSSAIREAEHLLLEQANIDRAARSLAPVQQDALLAQAALFHALQMADHLDISHGFAGEPDLSQRGAAAGVHFSLITENVAEAQNAGIIHGLWMQSPGHRANLLDPDVNVVGIAVVERDHEIFAVEDFASTVSSLSIEEQESTVLKALSVSGLKAANPDPKVLTAARTTCSMPTGYAGARQPWYVMRYTASQLDRLPRQLATRLNSGQYHQVAVGACASTEPTAFASYSVAILLYP